MRDLGAAARTACTPSASSARDRFQDRRIRCPQMPVNPCRSSRTRVLIDLVADPERSGPVPYVASTRTGLLGVEDDGLRAQVMADVQGSLRALGERALGAIEALETEKARVEARLLAAYGALHTIESQQVETLALTAGSLHVSADRVVCEEIALATGLGVGE